MLRERIRHLNDETADEAGHYVLYWMQKSQRAEDNHALSYALELANERQRPVVVGFGIMDDYPEANARHYAFMLEGLSETVQSLEDRGIGVVVKRGKPADVALGLSKSASVVVCDRGYLRHERQWRKQVADNAGRKVVMVESDVVVPVDTASDKSESAARTIRSKIHRHFEHCLDLPETIEPDFPCSKEVRPASDFDLSDPDKVLSELKVDRSVAPSRRFQGGSSEARHRLASFLEDKLKGYSEGRNEPIAQQCSHLSPYLHFGQISPLRLVHAARQTKGIADEDRASFIEELVVRRELAHNYVRFTKNYDQFTAMPNWAQKSMAEHAEDRREHVYDIGTLEACETHDPFWNAAMREMVRTGFMHNYMRMYWGKKILEWSPSYEEAFKRTLLLNNKYFLDGRDANSFANVGWIYGLHDRAWTERPVFGKLRYMNANGLKRKFDIEAYVAWSETLESASP